MIPVPALAVVFAAAAVSLLVDSPCAQGRRLHPPPPAVSPPPGSRRQRLSAAAGAGLAGAVLGSLVVGDAWLLAGVPCAVLGYWGSGRLESREQRSRRLAGVDGLPVTLELLAVCLEAGAPLRSAVHRVAALSPPGSARVLEQLDAAVSLGIDEPSAWERLIADPVWGPVATDVVRSLGTGTPSKDVLLQHAGEVRRAAHAARLAVARSVGVRSTLPLITCFLPAFLLLGVVPIVASLIPRLF